MNQVQRPSVNMKPAAQKAFCGGPAATSPDAATRPTAADQTHDPVCGMVVDSVTAKYRAELHGQRYTFCSEGCKAKFMAAPGQYLTRTSEPKPSVPSAANAPVDQGTIYTCPM